MYSTKSEGPRRGRSFDSMNIGLTLEEKQLNNEVSNFAQLFCYSFSLYSRFVELIYIE